MLTLQSPPRQDALPFIDLTVVDADFIPTEDPFIEKIHVWYEGLTPEMSQIEACGHDFLNYMRNIVGRSYSTLKEYWYSVHPRSRDKEVEEYLEYRANA